MAKQIVSHNYLKPLYYVVYSHSGCCSQLSLRYMIDILFKA